MDVLKFGFKYWKRNLTWAVIAQLVGYFAIIADLMIPLFSELFIDYVIGDNKPTNEGIFSFMLSGKYGQIHSKQLFFSLAAVFMIFLLTRIILIYIKNLTNQHLGLI